MVVSGATIANKMVRDNVTAVGGGGLNVRCDVSQNAVTLIFLHFSSTVALSLLIQFKVGSFYVSVLENFTLRKLCKSRAKNTSWTFSCWKRRM